MTRTAPVPAAPAPEPSALTSLALLLTATLTIMAGATIAPSLPAMSRIFADVPQSELLVRLVLTLPALFVALFSPLAGRLSDTWGRKPLLLSSMLLYAVSGAAGYFITDLWVLLVTRAVLGISVAGLMTANTSLMTDLYQGEARNRILGLQGVFINLGGTIFLTLGGWLAQQGWHLPFLIYLAPLLFLPLVWSQVPAVRPVAGQGGAGGRLPLGQLWPIYLIGFLSFLTFYLLPTQVPFYLSQRFGAGPSVSGVVVALTNLVGMFGGLFFARVGSRLSSRGLSLFSLTTLGLGTVLIGLASGYPVLIAGVLLLGMGVGVTMPNLTSWLARLAPPAQRGSAIGLLSGSTFLAQFVSPLISQPIARATSLSGMFWVIGGATLLIAALFAVFGRSLAESGAPNT